MDHLVMTVLTVVKVNHIIYIMRMYFLHIYIAFVTEGHMVE